ncbi:hypothetical protein C8F04DRAFT_1173245 [Mycena alexandri]|uniref:Uncharacterized protein n=1 Tax=Mycena alexandri TaxID=1745969 RepID=A0AAD6THH5_9AGAR|nr:hypothetical protein C8F04DRAFT_1173245 [Mycena alexandri]
MSGNFLSLKLSLSGNTLNKPQNSPGQNIIPTPSSYLVAEQVVRPVPNLIAQLNLILRWPELRLPIDTLNSRFDLVWSCDGTHRVLVVNNIPQSKSKVGPMVASGPLFSLGQAVLAVNPLSADKNRGQGLAWARALGELGYLKVTSCSTSGIKHRMANSDTSPKHISKLIVRSCKLFSTTSRFEMKLRRSSAGPSSLSAKTGDILHPRTVGAIWGENKKSKQSTLPILHPGGGALRVGHNGSEKKWLGERPKGATTACQVELDIAPFWWRGSDQGWLGTFLASTYRAESYNQDTRPRSVPGLSTFPFRVAWEVSNSW